MERWQLLILQVIAVFCTYLITSTTFVSAVEIRIFTSTGQETPAGIVPFSSLLEETFTSTYSQNYQYMQIQLSSKEPAALIKKIYLFRCKNFDPVQCIKNGIKPVISVNPGSSEMTFDETYRWDDISSGSVANFLTMIKLDVGGTEVWTGSWDKITKTGIRNFYHESQEAGRLDLYLKAGVSADAVKSYMENYYAVPAGDMNRTVFSAVSTADNSPVSRLYDLSGSQERVDPSGTGVPNFQSTNITGNAFNRTFGTWDFVFAGDGKISSPVVFRSASAGSGPGPGPEPGRARLIIDSWSPQIVTCGSSDVINANMHAENVTAGYFQSYYYTIGGAVAGSGAMTCSIVNPTASLYSYNCSIPVAHFPACNAPGTATITVYFNYTGGVQVSAGFPVTLKASVPRLVVSSLSPSPFDCGLDRQLTARLQVSNPLGESPKKSYSFDGKSFSELKNCTGSGASYTCSINETTICQLLQENLELTFKFVYGATEVLSLPANVMVTFPPPSMGIDTVTPQSVGAGNTTTVNVLLHVNYPDFVTYNENSFNYKYLNKDFAPVKCSLENSYTNIKYYKCSAALEIPSGKQGTETLSIRLDAYKDGVLKQMTANSFFNILPTPPQPSLSLVAVSPSTFTCIQNPSLTVSARTDNIQGTPQTQYSVDGGKTYKSLTCTPSGNIYSCTITKDDLCGLMSSSVTLLLKFTYPSGDIISSPQNVLVNLPEPHMQVYAVTPDPLPIGAKTGATVNLFVQYPQMVGSSPVFLYSYLGKANQRMTCTKVSSSSIRDFYECANTQFEIPDDYAKATLPVLFSIQGTTISFPAVINAEKVEAAGGPWLEIVSTIPARIEVEQGNETSASFHVTVRNPPDDLKHQATLVPNAWITAGTCTETNVQYYFNCTVTVKAQKTAQTGANAVTLTLKVTDKKTYDISNTTSVYVLAEEARLDIQSVTPEMLYCEGQKQTNPDAVKVTANTKNLAAFTLLEERMSFNGKEIAHTAKYCTQQAQSISCSIPSDKLIEKVSCGSGELAPGGGQRYYPLTLTFLVRAGNTQKEVSGSKDMSVAARPLEPYLEITDNDVADGVLQAKINCLDSQAIKLGDGGTGYVRIMYADLLHPEPKADDLKWSFTLNAQDDRGKLTKGMGVSPEANATVCKFKGYQRVGTHRIEDYECSLYTSYGMFQRCASGEGEILLVATSNTGKKAEVTFGVRIIKDDSRYQFDFEIVTPPAKDIDCQIQSYGKGVPCSLASYSNQNVTIRVLNQNEAVGTADLSLYDFDVKFQGGTAGVSANERSLGNCRKDSKDSDKYFCPFQIDPAIKLPSTDEYNVTKNLNQTDLSPISLGNLNVTIYIKYASGLEQKTLSRLDGSITIHPKKTDSMINAEKMLQKMQKTFSSFLGIFKWVTLILSFCAVCVAGNTIVDSVEAAGKRMKAGAATSTLGGGTPEVTAKSVQNLCNTCIKNKEWFCAGEFGGGCTGTERMEIYNNQANCPGGYGNTASVCEASYKYYSSSPLFGGGQASAGIQPSTGTTASISAEAASLNQKCSDCVKNNRVWCVYKNNCESDGKKCSENIPADSRSPVGIQGNCLQYVLQQECLKCTKSSGVWCRYKNSCDPSGKSCSENLPANSPSPVGTINTNDCFSLPPVSVTAGIVATSPGITGAQTATGSSGSQTGSSSTSASDTAGIIGSLAIAIGLVLTTMALMNMFGGDHDIDKEKSDIMENMKSGIKWGFVACVLPRIVGELGGWIAKKEAGPTSGWTKGFNDVKAFGQGMGDVCKTLMGLMPMIMQFIQFYISYLQFEMCMQTVEMQVEAGATAAGSASGQYAEAYRTQAEAMTAMGMSQSMMSCFNNLMNSMQQLSYTMMQTSAYLGSMGGTQTYVRYLYNGELKQEGDTLCGGTGGGTLIVQANLCKGGVADQSISIQGQGCSSQTVRGQCSYNMPSTYGYGGAYPSLGGYPYGQGSYYPGYPGGGSGFVGSSAGISSSLPTVSCQNGPITVTLTGAGNPQPVTFNYTRLCEGQVAKKQETAACDPSKNECAENLNCCKTGASPNAAVCAKPLDCMGQLKEGDICDKSKQQCSSGLACCVVTQGDTTTKCSRVDKCFCFGLGKTGNCKNTQCDAYNEETVSTQPEGACPSGILCCSTKNQIPSGMPCNPNEQPSRCQTGLKCCNTETSQNSFICSEPSQCLCTSNENCVSLGLSGQSCCSYSSTLSFKKCSPLDSCSCFDAQGRQNACKPSCGASEQETPNPLKPCPQGLRCCAPKPEKNENEPCDPSGQNDKCKANLVCCPGRIPVQGRNPVDYEVSTTGTCRSKCNSNELCSNSIYCSLNKCCMTTDSGYRFGAVSYRGWCSNGAVSGKCGQWDPCIADSDCGTAGDTCKSSSNPQTPWLLGSGWTGTANKKCAPP